VTRGRLAFWTAAMVAASAVVPRGAELLGYHAAGSIWSSLRLTWPWLSQAGLVLAGLIGGLLIGLLQWALLPREPTRWIVAAAVGGLFVGIARALYPPAALLAAPVAGALAGLAQRRSGPWARSQSMACAWAALAWMVPFPRWVRGLFLLGAAALSAWGIRPAPVVRSAAPTAL
jgi:hypothetical protein